MKKMIILMLAVVMLLGWNFGRDNAFAVLLTFDDVPGGSVQGTYGNMPTYNGFNFSSTLDWVELVGSSWPYGAHSGDFAILNNNGGVGTITKADASDFTFGGLWAKQWGYSPNSGGEDSLFGTLSGYNNGSLVWNVDTGLNGSYEFYGLQAGAIDELRLDFGNHFLVDDIYLNEDGSGGANPIPEPATLMLFGVGLAGMALRRRKV